MESSLMTANATVTASEGTRSGVVGFLRRNGQLIVGLLVSGWSIWQLGRTVDLAEVARHRDSIDWVLLGLTFGSIVVSMILKCVRWQYLFAERPAPPLSPLLSSLYIGYLMNTILPARIGELVRAVLIGRQGRGGTPAAFASIVLEKILDLATLALLLVALLLIVQLPEWVTPIAYTSAGALVVGFGGLAVLLAARKPVVRLVQALEARLPLLARIGLARLAASFLDGLAGLGRRDALPGLVFWSIAVWACSAFTMWAGLQGSGITAGMTPVLLTLVVTNIGMAVPSAPGYVGVFHYLVLLSLQPFGVDASHAVFAATVMHLTVFGNFIVGGLWFLWRGGYSLGGLRSASAH
jgi:uncharacterized protein (TIRG00374 family)